MALPAPARSSPQPGRRAPQQERSPSRRLRVAEEAAPRRSLGRMSTLAIFALFVVSLALAMLHAVLVENQAALDDLAEQNRLRWERIESLQATIARLDSPEGLAEHASAAGLVTAPELMSLVPLGAGLLPPPSADPFRLAGLDPSVSDPGAGARG